MKPYYQTELGTLYHGDYKEVIEEIQPRCNLVLTDPPYDKSTHKGAATRSVVDVEKDGDFGIGFSPLVDVNVTVQTLLPCTDGWAIFFCSLEMLGFYQQVDPTKYIRSGIWDRICNAPQLSGDRPAQGAEGIAIMHSVGKNMKWNGGGKAALWRQQVERGQKVHPTQKPLALFRKLLSQFSGFNDWVLDPFMGSGTTAIACEEMTRRWIGIEIEEEYCEVIVKRLEYSKKHRGFYYDFTG